MSLKAIAEETLARLRAGEVSCETKKESTLKQVKQEVGSCFINQPACFTPMKHVQPQITAENQPCFTVSLPRGETDETSLPVPIAEGLKRLTNMRVPRRIIVDEWRAVVADALRLAEEGWAAQAMAHGWSALDLFGATINPDGDPACDGLAVWLRGRPLLALTEERAAAEDGPRSWSYFLPCRPPGATLLWDIGR